MKTHRAPTVPQGLVVPLGYGVDPGGVWIDRGDGDLVPIASTPAWVTALHCDASGENWQIAIAFINPNGDRRHLVIPYASLLAGGPTLGETLAVRGILVLPEVAAEFRTYLALSAGQDAIPRVRGTRKSTPRTR
jgi:hypothetical protein